jgi:hypothetical protein
MTPYLHSYAESTSEVGPGFISMLFIGCFVLFSDQFILSDKSSVPEPIDLQENIRVKP